MRRKKLDEQVFLVLQLHNLRNLEVRDAASIDQP